MSNISLINREKRQRMSAKIIFKAMTLISLIKTPIRLLIDMKLSMTKT